MRDGYHNGRQSWWWRKEEDQLQTEPAEEHSSRRPATPPPEVRSTLPGVVRTRRESQPTYPGRRADAVENAALHALVVEPDIATRNRLVLALLDQGCHVNAFRTLKRAEIHAIYWGYDVLIASPEVLEQTSHWGAMIPGGPPLGALAITSDRDADVRIRALRAGAPSVLLEPFDSLHIGDDLQQVFTQLRREREHGDNSDRLS